VKPAIVIFLKEAREMMRDKRVVNAAFVAPVFMIVLFILLFGFIENKVSKSPDIKIGFLHDEQNALLESIRESGNADLVMVDGLEQGREKLKDGEVRVVVEFSPNFDEGLAQGSAVVTAYFDSTEPLSQIARSAVERMVDEMNKASARAVLRSHDISEGLLEPIAFEEVDTKKAEGLGASMIVALIPYLVVLWAFYGGFSTVSDLVAGEKERGTMETLLISPIRRSQVALGKFLALAVICLVSSLTTLVGVMAIGLLNLEITRAMFPSGLHVSFVAILGLFGVLVPLVVLFASLLLAVSAYAKNVREAQTYLTLVSFIVLMPAIFSQFIGFTGAQDAMWVRWTPILNSAVAIKEALLNELEIIPFLITAGTSLVLGLLMLQVAVRLFSREQILTRV
jgi:sodium transport system permease protein